MTQRTNQCSDENMKLAIKQQQVLSIVPCLQACFDKYKFQLFSPKTPTGVIEDIFWYAAFALDKASKTRALIITVAVCTYFRGFVMNYWRSYLSKNKNISMESIEDSNTNDIEDIASQSIISKVFEKEKMDAMDECIAKLDDKSQIIIRGYLNEKKDQEVAEELELSNWRSISVMRKRSFDKLRDCLNSNYPGLF